MTIKEKAYEALKELNGRATERELVEKYITMYPDYDKNYTDTDKTSKEKIRGTLYTVLISNTAHEKIKVDKNKKPYEYYIIDNNIVYPDEIKEDNNLYEGAKKQIIINAYERNSKAKQECLEHYGTKCFICDFDFEEKYGEIGKGFIHVHHIKPLSEINKEYKVNPIQDLRPVCPNCHAMIHKKKPAYSIEEIKSLLAKNNL